MQLVEYIGKTNFEMIHFSLALIKDIDYKIKNKAFFYQNQVVDYINDRLDYFIKTLHVKCSLQTVYKAEIRQILNPKLKKLFEKHQLFHCV